jgi:hypothetical protein
MRFIFILLSVLLLVFFFAPWVNLQPYFGFTLNGANICISLDKLEAIKRYTVDDLSFLKVSYLLYIIPVSAAVHIISNLLNKKGWYLRLDYFFSLIALFIMRKVVLYLNIAGLEYLDLGYYACWYISIAGLILQALSVFLLKKSSQPAKRDK